MIFLSIGLLKLTSHSKLLQKWLTALISLFLISPIFNSAQAQEVETIINQKACENFAVTSEIENRYAKIRENLEKDYNSGIPHKLKTELIKLRSETDKISQKIFDVADINTQEVNSLVKDTIDRLEKFIQLVPEISNNAPKVRDQYVVPFTNISSLKAEHQECLMTMAIEQAKNQVKDEPQIEEDLNIYKNLTHELNSLSNYLYRAETTDVQKFIQLRSELLSSLEEYNKSKEVSSPNKVVKNIPKTINAVQSEIEKLLPGLQLSKKYYSIIDL